MRIGTSNNVEGTGDRDLGFSALMRLPRGIRVCDIDPSPRCPKCNHAIAIFEAKRTSRKSNAWILAHTADVRIDASLLGVEAYFLCTTDAWTNLMIIRLRDFKEVKYTAAQFIQWLESKECRNCKKEKI